MSSANDNLILGEFHRTIDARFRVSIPATLLAAWEGEPEDYTLAKERPGCLSLWQTEHWQRHLNAGVQVVQSKLAAGRLGQRIADVQRFGRLLSTRHASVQLTGRARLLIPEGFREFLDVEPGGEVFIVGAAVCIEIWQMDAWRNFLRDEIPQFTNMLEELSQ